MLYFSCSDCFYGLIFAHKGGTQIPAMRSDIHEQSFCMSIVAQDIRVEKIMRALSSLLSSALHSPGDACGALGSEECEGPVPTAKMSLSWMIC